MAATPLDSARVSRDILCPKNLCVLCKHDSYYYTEEGRLAFMSTACRIQELLGFHGGKLDAKHIELQTIFG